jgi:peptide/nickel transport system permease protein
MVFAVAAGAIIGAIAGYYGGKTDDIIMRFMDILLSIPPMLMSISIVAALGQSMVNLLIALGIAYIPVFARVIRSSILSIKGQEFIEAAKACGTSDRRIILKHIIPNAVGPIIVQATLAMGSVILIISSLSFMGLGVKPPAPEWGTMLYEGRDFLRQAPYLTLFPGAAITIAVISLNLLGDGLRDALDPRLKD